MDKQKSTIYSVIILICVLFLSLIVGCIGCEKVPSGYVGVKVNLLGSDKGEFESLGIGRYYIGVNEDLFLFPTFKQNYIWTAAKEEGSPIDESLNFQTKEGLSVNADMGITYSIEPTKIITLFQKYRKGVDEITSVFLRSRVRDVLNRVASNYTVEDVYGENKVKLIDEVNRQLVAELAPEGIMLEKVYIINEFRLPSVVVDRINGKIEATQKAMQSENELREALAEAKKKVAEAEGEAKALRAKSQTLTPTLLEYERIKNQQMAIEKWNGEYPSTYVGDAKSVPLIQLK